MRRLTLLACLTLAALRAQSGRVISATTGEGLRKASVLLRGVGATTASYLTETDGSGNFAVANVAPGTYECVAGRVGFAAGPPNRVGSGTTPPQIVVVAGRQVPSVTLKLVPLGVISGRVVDSEGSPVRDAQVRAMRYSYSASGKTLGGRAPTTSDDRGEFRLFGLYPGPYFVEVTPMDERVTSRTTVFDTLGATQRYSQSSRLPVRGGSLPALHTTYFPNTNDVNSASTVEVPAGGEAAGTEIRMTRGGIFSVRASVPSGPASMMVWVEKRPPDPGFQWTGEQSQRDGELQLRGIPSGSYTIVAQRMTSNHDEPRLTARALVDISDSDIEGLPLQFATTMSVTGSVSVAGRTPIERAGVRVMLVGVETSRWNWSGTVTADGAMRFTDIVPDLYHFRVQPPMNLYVTSLELGDSKGIDQVLDLRTRSIEGLKVTVSSDMAAITGVVPPKSYVTLVPDQSRWDWGIRARDTIAGDDGRYQLEGVIPGHYTIFAWHDVERGTPLDADFRRPFEKAGLPVEVKPLDRLTINLKEADVK